MDFIKAIYWKTENWKISQTYSWTTFLIYSKVSIMRKKTCREGAAVDIA